MPLRFVRVRAADVDALSAAAAALGSRSAPRPSATRCVCTPGTGRRTGSAPTPTPPWWHWSRGSRGVLDLEWTRDAELLRARLGQPVDAGGDVVLTAAEETAYQRVITGFNRMWTLADPVDRFTY